MTDRLISLPDDRITAVRVSSLTLAEYLDVDSELIPKIGTAIGAGVSLNGLLCGSVSSVAMAIGIKYGRNSPEENPEPVWKMMDEYMTAFKKRFSYTNCIQLTGLNLKTPEGLKEYFARVHDYECTERLKFAVDQAVEILREWGKPSTGNGPEDGLGFT